MTTWRDYAACLDEDPELFHPPAGIASPSLAVRRATYAPAKAVCNGSDDEPPCPVRAECLAWINAHESGHGVWGGLDPSERESLRRRRDRAATRARKAMTPSAAHAAIAKAAAVAAVEEHCRDHRATVALLTTRGHSATEISRRVGISARQVGRYRAQLRAGVA